MSRDCPATSRCCRDVAGTLRRLDFEKIVQNQGSRNGEPGLRARALGATDNLADASFAADGGVKDVTDNLSVASQATCNRAVTGTGPAQFCAVQNQWVGKRRQPRAHGGGRLRQNGEANDRLAAPRAWGWKGWPIWPTLVCWGSPARMGVEARSNGRFCHSIFCSRCHRQGRIRQGTAAAKLAAAFTSDAIGQATGRDKRTFQRASPRIGAQWLFRRHTKSSIMTPSTDASFFMVSMPPSRFPFSIWER